MEADEKKGPAGYKLKQMPADVHSYLLERQGLLKSNCNCQRSLEFVIYQLIREHKVLHQTIHFPNGTKENPNNH